jgi:RNA-directed DNA polymerase
VAQLRPRDAGRELYHPFCNFVGSVLSPLLANLLLDRLDQEVEGRGHRCVRDADDGNLDVRRARAGARIRASVTRYLKRKLKRAVKAAKSAVDRPGRRTFLGFSLTARRPNRRPVRAQARRACKQGIRRLTPRPRGVAVPQVGQEGRRYVMGREAYWGKAAATSAFKGRDSGSRRRLRGELRKQRGRRRERELRDRGISRALEGGEVRARAVAAPPQSGADLGVTWSVLRRAWRAPMIAVPASLTPSAEPPDT